MKRHFDETFWWDRFIKHFDEIVWWDILMWHYDETFWWDILIRHFGETFLWDIFMINFYETFCMAGNGWKFVNIMSILNIKLLICTTGLSNLTSRVWHWLPWPCFIIFWLKNIKLNCSCQRSFKEVVRRYIQSLFLVILPLGKHFVTYRHFCIPF